MVRFFWAVHELRFRPLLDEWADRMDPGLVACIKSAGDPSAEDYLKMRQRKLDYIAAIHRWFEDWDLLLCVVMGSILAATDPVAVVGLLKELGASPTLTVQIQGESLLNDGTAIVLYTVAYRMLSGEEYDL